MSEDIQLTPAEEDFFLLSHTRAVCTNTNCDGSCDLCNLFKCSVCGLSEGSLTTHCYGFLVWLDVEDAIYTEGSLDFRFGAWVDEPNPTWQTWNKKGTWIGGLVDKRKAKSIFAADIQVSQNRIGR